MVYSEHLSPQFKCFHIILCEFFLQKALASGTERWGSLQRSPTPPGWSGGGTPPSLVPRPTLAVADELHHRYARNGSGKQPNKSRSRQFRANSDVMGVSLINGNS